MPMGATSENGNDAEGSPRRSLEEAIAALGEPKDIDRLAIFVGRQTVDMARMIEGQTRAMADLLKRQADAMIGLMKFLGERISHLEAEVARLKAQRDAPSDVAMSETTAPKRIVLGSFEAGATAIIIPSRALDRASKAFDAERQQREALARKAKMEVMQAARARGRLKRALELVFRRRGR
jgi:hypothetical protein